MKSRTGKITKIMNNILNQLLTNSEFEPKPVWNEETQHWHVEGMRYQHVYVETLEGQRIPVKWAFQHIYNRFGIESKDLHAYKIKGMFEWFGLKTGIIGKEEK
jgi:hypothetical protein